MFKMQGRIFNGGVTILFVVLLGIVACSARPPRSDNIFSDTIQDNGSLDNSLPMEGHPGNKLLGNPEDAALAGLQLQLLQQYANYNSMRNLPWEQMLRAPQDKRQIRYRQCYFNPISCFRK